MWNVHGASFSCLTDVSSVRVESTDMIATVCVSGNGIGGSGVEFIGKYIQESGLVSVVMYGTVSSEKCET